MRILFLTQWFEPEPTFKGLAFARQLKAQGHDVEVLTGFPNYPEGKLYEGYSARWCTRETIDGISVVRVPLYASHDTSAVRRAWNYLSFALSASLLGPLLVRHADVVYVYSPPGTIALPAFALRMLRGMPFVYDVNDLWPDSLPATGLIRNRAVLRLVALWSRLTYALAARVVVGSPGMKACLEARGVPSNKVVLIHNWVDEANILQRASSTAAAAEPAMKGRFNVVFAGNMGKAQALDAVIDAAAIVALRSSRVQFVFIGGGVDVGRLKARKAELKLTNVLFLPRRPMSEIGPILVSADVLLVHLRDEPLFEITLPSKTQAYLAAGRPILMAVRGDAAALVEASGGGLSCTPEHPEALADAVMRFAAMGPVAREEMGKRGAQFYQRELSLASGTRRFEQLFGDVAR